MLSSKTSVALMRPPSSCHKVSISRKTKLTGSDLSLQNSMVKPQALRGLLLAFENKSHSVAKGDTGLLAIVPHACSQIALACCCIWYVSNKAVLSPSTAFPVELNTSIFHHTVSKLVLNYLALTHATTIGDLHLHSVNRNTRGQKAETAFY